MTELQALLAYANAVGGGSTAVYIAFGESFDCMMNSWIDVHGADSQWGDPKSGDPDEYPYGGGPQGDAIRFYHYIRCARDTG